MARTRRKVLQAKEEAATLKTTRSLLQKHRKLDHILEDLQKRLTQGKIGPLALASQLEVARAIIPNKHEYISKRMLNVLVPEYCPPNATGLAQRTFDIPELLESILIQLNTRKLLAIQCVNRQFRNAVESSTRLQRKLGFVPYIPGNFYSAFEGVRFPGFKLDVSAFGRGPDRQDDDPVSPNCHGVEIGLSLKGRVPKVGTTCRRMLVAQPNLTSIDISNECCYGFHDPEGSSRNMLPVVNLSGLSVGDLLSEAEKMIAAHRRCPLASGSQLDGEGNAIVCARFDAHVPLSFDDPMIAAFETERGGNLARDEEARKNRRMMRAYAEARFEAYDEDETPPEFEEWRKTFVRPEEDDDDNSASESDS